jgi:hypothetical protein
VSDPESDFKEGLTSEPTDEDSFFGDATDEEWLAEEQPSDWRADAARRWRVPALWKPGLLWLLAAGMLLAGLVFGSGPRSFLRESSSSDPLFFAVVIGACLMGIGLASLMIAAVTAGVMKYLFLPFFGVLARAFCWVAPVLGLFALVLGYLDREQGIPWLNALATSTASDHAAIVQWTPDGSPPGNALSITPQVTLPPTEDDVKNFKNFHLVFAGEVVGARRSWEQTIKATNGKMLLTPARIFKDEDGSESAAIIAAARQAEKTLRDTVNRLYEGRPARIKALELSPTFLPKALEICEADKGAILPILTENCDLEEAILDLGEKEIRFLGARRLVWSVSERGGFVFQLEEDHHAFAEMEEEMTKVELRKAALAGKLRENLAPHGKAYPKPD